MDRAYRSIALGLLLCLALTGCSRGMVLFGVGAATVVTLGGVGYFYVKGDLETEKPDALDKVFNAGKEGLTKLGYKIVREEQTDEVATIDAEKERVEGEDKEKKVRVTLKKTDAGPTHVSIRVGVFGSEEKSKQILAAIEENL